jgi:multidrug resistance protein MdtO
MAVLANSSARRSPFLDLLADELAPREGRVLAVAHIATACVITVTIAMIFRIPEPTYMAYIVFLVSKDEKGATVTTAMGGQIAVTLAVILTLGLMLVDLSEPAVRLPAMALVTFVAMYTTRTFVLGPITYLAGFVLVLLQSVVDDVPSPEVLTRLTLWMWVVLLVPVVVTVLLNLLFGQSAYLLTERTVRKVLSELETAVRSGDVARHLALWREGTVALLEKHQSAPSPSRAHPQLTVTALHRLVDVLLLLDALPAELNADQRNALAGAVRACRRATEGDISTPNSNLPADSGQPAQPDDVPALLAATEALRSLQREIEQPATTPPAATTPARRPLFAPDAFTNPTHWQFALKTTLAVMVVYAVYTLLDWPGMRTSIVTCFFVALGSLGETMHKLTLRIAGALIGGLIAGLSIVFLLPHLTDIGQLCLLVAVVSAGAGWIATSSERLAYAGLQIAFAFFLGILQGYAPANDLTVLRDRLAGIVLGNVVITLVFSLLWPESARTRLRALLAESLRWIGAAVKGGADSASARIHTAQTLVKADQIEALCRFELSMLSKPTDLDPSPELVQIEQLSAAAFVALSTPLLPFQNAAMHGAVSQWMQSAAKSIETVQPLPVVPTLPLAAMSGDAAPALTAPGRTQLARRATEELFQEMEHVARATR